MAQYASFNHQISEQYANEFDQWFEVGKRDYNLGLGWNCKDGMGRKLVGAAQTGYRAGYRDADWKKAA
ncbi:MAG: hypothetical protein AAFO83_00095 [Cyanobacteria bacterium J06607_13]